MKKDFSFKVFFMASVQVQRNTGTGNSGCKACFRTSHGFCPSKIDERIRGWRLRDERHLVSTSNPQRLTTVAA